MDYTMLINKKEGLNNSFVPDSLVNIDSKYKEGMQLNETVYINWLALKDLTLKKGFHIEIESAYRSYDYQATVLAEIIEEKGEDYAKKAVAQPGHSEHQTGLAFDYCVYKNGRYIIEHELDLLSEVSYTNSIAHLFGFIIRYPKGKEVITGYMYEPWHLRYVGVELATYLYENNLTLEEYYQSQKEEKML